MESPTRDDILFAYDWVSPLQYWEIVAELNRLAEGMEIFVRCHPPSEHELKEHHHRLKVLAARAEGRGLSEIRRQGVPFHRDTPLWNPKEFPRYNWSA